MNFCSFYFSLTIYVSLGFKFIHVLLNKISCFYILTISNNHTNAYLFRNFPNYLITYITINNAQTKFFNMYVFRE